MSEKNWPDPVGSVQIIQGVTIGYMEYKQPVGTNLYTAAQVREIVAAELAAVRAKLAEDAERYKFAVSPGAGGSMNWLDVYEAWNGDGDFTAAIDAARAAKGGE